MKNSLKYKLIIVFVDVSATAAAFVGTTVHQVSLRRTAVVSPRWSTEKATRWTGGSGKRYTSGKNKTSRWIETRGPTNFYTSMIT